MELRIISRLATSCLLLLYSVFSTFENGFVETSGARFLLEQPKDVQKMLPSPAGSFKNAAKTLCIYVIATEKQQENLIWMAPSPKIYQNIS